MTSKLSLLLILFLLPMSLSGCGSSEPWQGIDSGQGQVFKITHSVSMVDVLPAENTDSYGQVTFFIRMDDGDIYSPLVYRRSTVLGGSGTRADVEQIVHGLDMDKTSDGRLAWSSFPIPVDSRITEYVLLYRGPFKRGNSAGDLDEHWAACSYTLEQLKSQRPQPEDFSSDPRDLVGDDWVDLIKQADNKRYEYRSKID